MEKLNFTSLFDIAVTSVASPIKVSAGEEKENQDNYLIIDQNGLATYLRDEKLAYYQMPNWPQGHSRIAVTDGMGGHGQGREAAENIIVALLTIPATTDHDLLNQQLDEIHQKLHHSMHIEGKRPGATLTLLEIPPHNSLQMGGENKKALLFHAGDSRLYKINANKVDYLTIDHVPATRIAMFNLMEPQEWYQQVHQQHHPLISQAFILGNSLAGEDISKDQHSDTLLELNDKNTPDFLHGLGDRRTIELESGCVYILASDGFWNLRRPDLVVERWADIFADKKANLQQQMEQLLKLLAHESTLLKQDVPDFRTDNSTAIAIRIA